MTQKGEKCTSGTIFHQPPESTSGHLYPIMAHCMMDARPSRLYISDVHLLLYCHVCLPLYHCVHHLHDRKPSSLPLLCENIYGMSRQNIQKMNTHTHTDTHAQTKYTHEVITVLGITANVCLSFKRTCKIALNMVTAVSLSLSLLSATVTLAFLSFSVGLPLSFCLFFSVSFFVFHSHCLSFDVFICHSLPLSI